MSIFITITMTLLLVVAASEFQAQWYKANKPIKWWWHPLWVLPFLILPAMVWFTDHDWKLVLIVLGPRVLFFSPILNLFRKQPFFYLHGESNNGSWWDKQLEKLTPHIYEGLWYITTTLYISFILLYILFF